MTAGLAARATREATAKAATPVKNARRETSLSLAIAVGVYIAAPTMSRLVFAITAIAVAAIVATPVGQPAPLASDLLRGTIDIHVHSDPDNVPRSVDGIEAARQAKAKGMRGLVLKNHYDPTAGLAYLARKEAPGLEVFGGVDLNLAV